MKKKPNSNNYVTCKQMEREKTRFFDVMLARIIDSEIALNTTQLLTGESILVVWCDDGGDDNRTGN